MLILVFFLMIFGFPIAFSIGIPSIIYLLIKGPHLITIQRLVGGINSYSLLAIPLFILAGNIMNVSGLTGVIFDFCAKITSRLKGGLGHANVLASIIFAGMSGSAVADAGGLGLVEIKAMREKGYLDSFTLGITGASSIIGPIIPPSIVMVIYGVVSDTSIGRLFAGGILPGLLMGLSLMTVVYFLADKYKCPSLNLSISLKELLYSFKNAFFALIAPAIILGGIFFGIFTPTEAAAVVTLYSILIGIIVYRKLNFEKLYSAIIDTIKITAKVMLIISFSSLFGWILAKEQVPQFMASLILGLTKNNYYTTLFLINVLLLIVGMFLDQIPAITILCPVFYPIIRIIGIDPVHFGVMMVLNLMIGALTPPFGQVLFTLSIVAKTKLEYVIRSTAIFVIPIILVLILVILFPMFTLTLPNLIYGCK